MNVKFYVCLRFILSDMKKLVTLITVFIFCLAAFSQNGGEKTYKFLNIPTSAHISAQGGFNVSHIDGDLNYINSNPAMLTADMNNQFALSYTNYVSDINLGYAIYARNFEKAGIFAAGIQYLNYGKFYNTNEFGEILGNFHAADYAINISYAYPLKKFNFGGTLKTIVSDYWEATSFGVAVDLGATYKDTASLFSAGMVVKNLGFQIKRYTKGVRESLPIDLQLGITKKFKHAPFSISVTAIDLFNWSLRYESNLRNNYQNSEEQKENFLNKLGHAGDEFMRHIVISADINIKNVFYVSLGFNYRRRSELALVNKGKIVGFSAGLGLCLKKFSLEYSYSSYHIAGAVNYISLKINLDNIIRKNG